jgi:hypothetical protein
LLSAVSPIVALLRDEDAHFTLGVGPSMPPGRIADIVAHRLVSEPRERQEILEALDVRRRLALVTHGVSERLASLPRRGTLQ